MGECCDVFQVLDFVENYCCKIDFCKFYLVLGECLVGCQYLVDLVIFMGSVEIKIEIECVVVGGFFEVFQF